MFTSFSHLTEDDRQAFMGVTDFPHGRDRRPLTGEGPDHVLLVDATGIGIVIEQEREYHLPAVLPDAAIALPYAQAIFDYMDDLSHESLVTAGFQLR
jgi:hypothetical protein